MSKPWCPKTARRSIAVSGDVLGHPFHSVAWLATHLAAQGSRLRAGDIVMTGSVVTTKFPDRSTRYHYELTGRGAVELSINV